MFEKFIKAIAKGIAEGIAEGTSSARVKGMMNDVDECIATNPTSPCGVCGMRIPQYAQVCPYCQRQPNCRNTGRGNQD